MTDDDHCELCGDMLIDTSTGSVCAGCGNVETD